MLDYRATTFLTVCRCGGYTKAAAELHISQPAVSQHIRQLEQHYGCALFERKGRAIRPTHAGNLLFRRLDALNQDEARIEREVSSVAAGSNPDAETLNFGCTKTIGDYVAPKLIAHHLVDRRQTHVRMFSGNTDALVQRILDGDIDFALVEGSFDRENFDSALLSHESYIAVAQAGSAADTPAGHRPASIDDLLGFQLILREKGSGTRQIIEHLLAARGLAVTDFKGTLELGTISAIKACVEAGVGITFLYRIAVEHELDAEALEDITPRDFALAHDFRLIWQRGSQYADRYRSLAASWRHALSIGRGQPGAAL